MPPLFLGALAIAVVALADTMSTASAFAARRGEQVRGNQEMIGIGAANIAAGFFQGFPVSTSGSRTAVAEQAGSRSQITGVVGAAVITLVLVFATGAMEYVPQPTLGAIVIAAALSLADIAGTRRLWRQRRMEFTLSIIALLGVALLGVLPGILVAVGLSILNVFRRTWWPHHAELGRVDGIAGLHDTERYPDAELLPGLVVYRFDAPLIFANARMFGEAMRAIAEQHQDLRWIVIAAEPITDVDTTASDMLQELDLWLNERGVSLVFAEMKDPVREKIERYELTRHDRSRALLPDARRGARRVRPADGCDVAEARGRCHDHAHRGCAVADILRPPDRDPMTSPTPAEPVEERLADRLSTRLGHAPPSWVVRVLRRLGRLDRAAYRAVADLSTPRLDRPLRRVSNFANLSKLWFIIAGVLALFGGAPGRRAAVTGVAAIGLTSLMVNQPMKLAGGRAPSRPYADGRPREPLGADAGVDLIPFRPLGIGSGVRRLGRGRTAPTQVATAVGRRGCGVLSRLHRRALSG